jgi:hypothetical protein
MYAKRGSPFPLRTATAIEHDYNYFVQYHTCDDFAFRRRVGFIFTWRTHVFKFVPVLRNVGKPPATAEARLIGLGA